MKAVAWSGRSPSELDDKLECVRLIGNGPSELEAFILDDWPTCSGGGEVDSPDRLGMSAEGMMTSAPLVSERATSTF